MTVAHVEVLVEELSMEAALRDLLPRVLGGISFQILLDRLPERLRGRLQG